MNTTTEKLSDRGLFGYLKILLRGSGQVMFQGNAWTGLLFLIGIFWGAYSSHTPAVAWGALLGAEKFLTTFMQHRCTDIIFLCIVKQEKRFYRE